MNESGKPGPLSLSTRLLLACFAVKLVFDICTISVTWPDHSRPKLGIAMAAPFVMWGLLARKRWALSFAGVICFFWLAFLVARSLGPLLTIGPVQVDFPWSNLLAIPALVMVLNGITADDSTVPTDEP